MYANRNGCDGARSGCVLCASQPIDPAILWYFCLHSMKVGLFSSSSDSGHALIGRPKLYGVALGVTFRTWLGKSPTCRQHVGPTAKCRHFWLTSPCRGDTKPIPTQYFCVGDCRHSPNFFLVPELHPKNSSVTFGRNIWLISVQPRYFLAPLNA